MSRSALVRVVFLAMALTSCGTALEEVRPDPVASVRSAAASTPAQVVVPPQQERPRVLPSNEEFLTFMRRTVSLLPATEQEVRALMGRIRQAEWFPESPRIFQVVPAVGEPLAPGALEMVRQYETWCRARGQSHDCSGGLKGKPYIDAEGRYRIAFDSALRNEWSGFTSEMRGMASFENVKVVLLTAMVIYMATIAIPELTTKFVAAAITLVLTAYLGAQAVWDLVGGWFDMVRDANAATTFAQLVAAGERYGKKVGAQVARILVMVVTAAIAEGGLVARC